MPILAYDSILAKVAKEWSEHLVETGTLSHGAFEDRMAKVGYYGSYGEIIGMQSGPSPRLSQIFVDMWLNSREHREIMLIPFNGSMGVGVSKTKGINVSNFYSVVDFRFG